MEISFLQELSQARGVSGDENEVRNLIAKKVRGLVDSLKTDTIGNFIAYKKGSGGSALKVMVAAHMDEVGLMIMGADGNGFLRFEAVGGIDARVLPAKRVLVGPSGAPGIIGVKPVHRTIPSERRNVLAIDHLYIDIGAKSKDEALGIAPLGSFVSFDTPFTYMAGACADKYAGCVSGKALDDRSGCFALASLLEQNLPFDLYAVFTVQEEVGLRGSHVAAYSVNPDVAFVLEGTVCDDSPKDEDISPTTKVGFGPAITITDGSVVANRRLVDLLMRAAEAEGIPYQFKQPNIGGTDAGAIHLARAGVACSVLATPCRYIHSPESVMSLSDLQNTGKLIAAALMRLPEVWQTSGSCQ